jgi:hypothetical protein
MPHFATMKRLIDMGLPDRWIVPVMEVFEADQQPVAKKRRKRRTKEQIAADAARAKKKKNGRA